jgi:hypothetical protein
MCTETIIHRISLHVSQYLEYRLHLAFLRLHMLKFCVQKSFRFVVTHKEKLDATRKDK